MGASPRGAVALILLWCTLVAWVQARVEVLSTVIYTHHGDRKPLLTADYPILSPLGMQQMYAAGSRIRSRYVVPEVNSTTGESQTWRLEPTFLSGDALSILAINDPYNSASAQTFMQALYPPLAPNGTWSYIDSSFFESDGTLSMPVLNGIQFPSVMLTRDRDVSSMYLKGATNCPAFSDRMATYRASQEYLSFETSRQAFYDQLLHDGYIEDFPEGVIIGYANAWFIYDYLNYQSNHNRTIAQTLPAESLALARIYAAEWVFAMYANTSEFGRVDSDPLNAIAGRTLASRVLQSFANAILNGGRTNKVNLLFGDFQPMVSFAALAGLMVPSHAAFSNNLPVPGSSFIFELFAVLPDSDNSTDWPSAADMRVRFLYTNGTDEYTTTIAYPLFGVSPSQTVMTLSDFTYGMAGIEIANTSTWCTSCQSTAPFCIAAEASAYESTPPSRHGLSPAVAGVIGALVALVFVLLVLGLVMLLGGFRVHQVSTKRRSELGGFKGAEKLASDLDLTMPKGGAGAVVTVADADGPRGHERVGSWELRDQMRQKEIEAGTLGPDAHGHAARRSSFEDDEIHINPFSDPVRPRDSV